MFAHGIHCVKEKCAVCMHCMYVYVVYVCMYVCTNLVHMYSSSIQFVDLQLVEKCIHAAYKCDTATEDCAHIHWYAVDTTPHITPPPPPPLKSSSPCVFSEFSQNSSTVHVKDLQNGGEDTIVSHCISSYNWFQHPVQQKAWYYSEFLRETILSNRLPVIPLLHWCVSHLTPH